MKRSSLLILCVVVLGMILTSAVWAQQRARAYQTLTLEDFDDPDGSPWMVRASRFIREDFPSYQHVRTWPDALYRREPEGMELRSLGIHAQFNRRGYNYLEILPAQMGDDGELVPRIIPGSAEENMERTGMRIPGLAEELNLWVWGSNHDYYLEVMLRDHRGMVHTLRVGDINFLGWRNLRVQIPTWIPQTTRHVPGPSGIELVKFVLWTRPTEKVDNFYVYLDELKVFTDVFAAPFDGEFLGDPETIRELWNQEGGL